MSANSIRYPLFKVAKRGFVAQTTVRKTESQPYPEIECIMLPNKLMVSSLDLCGPLSRISVIFRCGPRNETAKNLGIVHVIRSMTGFSSTSCSGFAIVRNLQQNGVHFTCTGDREITAFHVVATRDKITSAFKYLAAASSTPAFKPWQVLDNLPRIKYEIGSVTPQARMMDILHKAAYRTGLGNSLFIKKDHVGMHTSEMLHSFYRDGFTANRAVVCGYNVNQKYLLDFVKDLDLGSNDPQEGNSKYFGGEIRKDKMSYNTHVSIATEGASCKDIKQALIYSVLQHALGARTVILWGNSPSPMIKAVSAVAPDTGVGCFNINYSDSGLFGFVINSSRENAGKAVEAAFKVLKSGSVSEADVKRAKALVKMNILSSCENSEFLHEDIGLQSLFAGVVIPPQVLAEAVENISTSDVIAAAQKVAKGKFSLAAVGNLDNVPYLDQLS